jgi:hypothetical protein
MRRPVGVIQTSREHIIVVCDDGTMWLQVPPLSDDIDDKGEWEQIGPPIPGTPATEGQGSN